MCAMAQKLGNLPLGDGHPSSIINPFIASYLPIFSRPMGPMGWAHPPCGRQARTLAAGRSASGRAEVAAELVPVLEGAGEKPPRTRLEVTFTGFLWGNPLQNLGKRWKKGRLKSFPRVGKWRSIRFWPKLQEVHWVPLAMRHARAPLHSGQRKKSKGK